MIACSPKIVAAPTPSTGLPANSFASTTGGNPFSAALQAATQNLLHPSPKSHLGIASPMQKTSTTSSSKAASASAGAATQASSPSVTSPVLPASGLIIPAGSPSVALNPVQPATIDEAKLQAVTLDGEQKQSAAQTANVATTSAQATASVSPESSRFMPTPLQFGGGATGTAGSGSSVLPGLQAMPLSRVLSVPQNSTSVMPSGSQPLPRSFSGVATLPAAKEMTGTVPQSPVSSNPSHALANPTAQLGRPVQQTVPVTSPANANPSLPTNDTRPAPNQPAHNGLTMGTKDQTVATEALSATVVPIVSSIPLQMIAPDVNTKIPAKPAETMQTSPVLAASPAANSSQPSLEVSRKNGDAAGSNTSQSGTGKGSPSSFAAASSAAQTADSNSILTGKGSDTPAAATVAAPQLTHPVASVNDAPGASDKTNNHAAETIPSSVAGAAEADARIQAAASYANSLLHSARLVERAGQTELRVGIQTGEFGNVDIRTSMVRNQFTAQISVERGELGKVLAAELPNLQNKLSEQRLPMSNITLQQQAGGGSSGSGQGSRYNQATQPFAMTQSAEADLPAALLPFTEGSISTGRLDVHM